MATNEAYYEAAIASANRSLQRARDAAERRGDDGAAEDVRLLQIECKRLLMASIEQGSRVQRLRVRHDHLTAC